MRVQKARIAILSKTLERLGSEPSEERTAVLDALVNAASRAVALYPTSARLRAGLADVAAESGRYADAARQAREALRLDALTPHQDKKLPAAIRSRLKAAEPAWRAGKATG